MIAKNDATSVIFVDFIKDVFAFSKNFTFLCFFIRNFAKSYASIQICKNRHKADCNLTQHE